VNVRVTGSKRILRRGVAVAATNPGLWLTRSGVGGEKRFQMVNSREHSESQGGNGVKGKEDHCAFKTGEDASTAIFCGEGRTSQ